MTSTFCCKNTHGVKISTKSLLRNSIVAIVAALVVASPILYAGSSLAFHTQYNLPLPSALEHEPSYAIRIPFGAAGTGTGYDPANVSIPAGMTVVWFNDDSAQHTVTALTNESEQGRSSPVPVLAPLLEPVLKTIAPGGERFDSGVIPPGGFSVFTFTKPGTYPYYDEFNPSHRGQINVGDLMERGKNMDMRIGGDLPFNISELGRVVLSFIPKNISLPPPLELTYNVTISNSTGPVYTHEFGDIDGILDLEIIPVNKLNLAMQVGPGTNASNNTTGGNVANNTNATASSAMSTSTIETTTYGPDLNSPITGTYHIEGPILVEPTSYSIKVEVTKVNGIAPSQPIVDEFIIPAQVGG
jgi:plastocyanin